MLILPQSGKMRIEPRQSLPQTYHAWETALFSKTAPTISTPVAPPIRNLARSMIHSSG